jgi:2-oxoglutarate dehydrogenase complex dehydrogenase (E1) component-like enzyme
MIKVGSKQNRLYYAGRKAQASTATGLFNRHQQEQKKLLDKALFEKTK